MEPTIFNRVLSVLLSTGLAFLTGTAGCLTTVGSTGCAPNQEPLERIANRITSDVVKPIVEKAITEVGTRTATLQGGAQAIEPGYIAEFEGYLVQGVKGRISVYVKGVSGQILGHAQADSDIAPAPAPTSRPTTPTNDVVPQ